MGTVEAKVHDHEVLLMQRARKAVRPTYARKISKCDWHKLLKEKVKCHIWMSGLNVIAGFKITHADASLNNNCPWQ
jgi:hypothetical protein